MPLANTPARFGLVARVLHWLSALVILTAIGLGLYGAGMPFDTGETLAAKAQVYSLHKTLGVAAFFVALVRILWALTQARPVPLHPERRLENWLADLVHWMLYLSLLLVPLTGWVHHAATTGFAPILWPFGQGLPLVPKSETVEQIAQGMHWGFGRLLIMSVILHVTGALKHHFMEGDGTLMRMVAGHPAPAKPRKAPRSLAPMLLAFTAFAAVAFEPLDRVLGLIVPPAEKSSTALPASSGGNWKVAEGTLGFRVRQMGATLKGSFAGWTAKISFDEASGTGNVAVVVDMTSLSLGSVTAQAKAPDFLDTAANPTATFIATIRPDGSTFLAEGTLTLRGTEKPLTLPFTLTIEGDRATMEGRVAIDRRAFGIGARYSDEKTVGFVADVTVALTATRQD